MTSVLDALTEHLERHLDGFSAFTVRTRWETTGPEAPYERELYLAARQYGPAEYWTDEQIKRGLLMATLELSVCAQLLEGVVACLRSHDVLFPLAPLIRSVEERLGHIGWLLATGQAEKSWSIRDRVIRVLLAQIDDLTFQKAAAIDLQRPNAVRGIVRRRKELKAKRTTMFYPSETETLDENHPDHIIIRCQVLPSVSNLNAHIGGGAVGANWNHRGVYRVLSNATHPAHSHLLNFVNVDDDGSTGWSLKDPTYVNRMVRAALVGFGTTWELLAVYLGYPSEETRRLQHAFDDDPRLAGL